MNPQIKDFYEKHFRKSGTYVPGRVQASLVLLERLRKQPSLRLVDHETGQSKAGIKSHETLAKQWQTRYEVPAINSNSGRRASNLQSWGQPLLDLLGKSGFDLAQRRAGIIDQWQNDLVSLLRSVLEAKPIIAITRGRSEESIISGVLDDAAHRGLAGQVAQYLVGAKLMLKYPDLPIPKHPFNKGDRRHLGDKKARIADFDIANTAIEVAVGPCDDKHVEQIIAALRNPDIVFRLLVRSARLRIWTDELALRENIRHERLVVTSIESFVGQNISEIARFDSKASRTTLNTLIDIYNREWVDHLGPATLRIEMQD